MQSVDQKTGVSTNSGRNIRNRIKTLPWTVWFGGIVLVMFGLAGLLGPLISPHNPSTMDSSQLFANPSWKHPLGTDHLGRDLLARVIHGSRISLGVTLLTGLLILVTGAVIGVFSGYIGGVLDRVVSAIMDVLLAFPGLVVALVLAGTLGPSLSNIVIALVAVQWVPFARIVRGLVLSIRERPYIAAAAVGGASRFRLLHRQVLPTALPSLVVLAALECGTTLISIAGLSFLGLGAQPPIPEWGVMLSDFQGFLQVHPWMIVPPGSCIVLATLAFYLLGDGMRDHLDPFAVSGGM